MDKYDKVEELKNCSATATATTTDYLEALELAKKLMLWIPTGLL